MSNTDWWIVFVLWALFVFIVYQVGKFLMDLKPDPKPEEPKKGDLSE
jgi:Na+-transporting methylmalonyl-CoA/oxaloacetate decarboxylase gamma subunit